MRVISVDEAKTKLSWLLDRVSEGHEYTITKHGAPVAMLVPPRAHRRPDIDETIEAIKEWGRNHTLGGMTIRELIEEGRQY